MEGPKHTKGSDCDLFSLLPVSVISLFAYYDYMVVGGIQMVLGGKAQCAWQVVTVSNGEGKVIAHAKPQYTAVRPLHIIRFLRHNLLCS